jgi:hypothetical protein
VNEVTEKETNRSPSDDWWKIRMGTQEIGHESTIERRIHCDNSCHPVFIGVISYKSFFCQISMKSPSGDAS